MIEMLSNIDRINQSLLVLLNEDIQEDNEKSVPSIEQLLKVRELLIREVTLAQSVEEKKLGQKIISDNNVINDLFQKRTRELKVKINQFNQKKINNGTYDNSYESMPIDGIFIDKKK